MSFEHLHVEYDCDDPNHREIMSGIQAFDAWAKEGKKLGVNVLGAAVNILSSVLQRMVETNISEDEYKQMAVTCAEQVLQAAAVAAGRKYKKNVEQEFIKILKDDSEEIKVH